MKNWLSVFLTLSVIGVSFLAYFDAPDKASAAISLTNKENNVSTSFPTTTTGSLSWTAGARGIASVVLACPGGGTTLSGHVDVAGGSETWNEIGFTSYGSRRGVYVFLSDSVPTNGTLSITYDNGPGTDCNGAGTPLEIQYSIDQMTGFDTGNPDDPATTASGASGTSLNIADVGTIDTGDVVYAAFGMENANDGIAPATGSTEHVKREGGGNVRSLLVAYSTTDDTPGATWNSTGSAGGVAFIINVGEEAPVDSTNPNVQIRGGGSGGGSETITQTGSNTQYGPASNANTGTVSSSVTVPADAELVVVAVSGWRSTANPFSGGSMTFTKGGVDTAMTPVIGGDSNTSYNYVGMFYLALPDTGSGKSLKWDWEGSAVMNGAPVFSVTYWKGVDTSSPVRDSDGAQNSDTPYTTPTLTAISGDLILAWAGGLAGAEATVDSWSNLTELAEITIDPANGADGAWATGSPSGDTTVAASTDTNFTDGGIVALVLKAGSGDSGSINPYVKIRGGRADSFSGTTLYVNTGSTAGGDCTTNLTSGSTRACATLLEAVNLLPATLTTPYRIYTTGSTADTSAINQTPFDQTTSAANYLWIIGEQSPNHFSSTPTGSYDTNKYRLEVTNVNALYNNLPGHLRIEGLQIKITRSSGDGYIGIKCSNSNQNYADVDCRLSHNIVTLTGTKGNTIGIENRPAGQAGALVKVWNNLVYDFGQCFTSDLQDAEFYNNTAAGCTYGFVQSDTPTFKVVNNLVTGATIGFVGSFTAASNYNAEDDGNGAPGAQSRSAVTFTFVNAGAKDYHLQSSDAGAKDFGTSDPGSGLFSDDIDGQTRSGTWDIGADEQGASSNGNARGGSVKFR